MKTNFLPITCKCALPNSLVQCMCLCQFLNYAIIVLSVDTLLMLMLMKQSLKSHKRTEFVLKSGITDQHKLKLHVTLTEKNSCFMNIKDLQVETFSNKITYWSSKASQLPASKQAQAL